MAAAVVQSRKRCATPFLDEEFPAPPHLSKRGRFSPPPLASRISRAAARSDMDECAGVLVEQMAAASDLTDAEARASWVLALVKDAVAERAAAALRASSWAARLKEDNASLRASSASLKEENASLRAQAAAEAAKLAEENAVLKRGVVLLHARHEEAERAAAEARKRAAELEMANYALGVRLRDADSCRFQVFRGHDAF